MTFHDITLQKRVLCLLRPNEYPMHVPKGTNKIYSHFKLDCNKSNQSVSQINKTIIPNRWGCIEKGMSIWSYFNNQS